MQGSFPLKTTLGTTSSRRKDRGAEGDGVWGGVVLFPTPQSPPRKIFRFWILNRRILLQTECFLYSSPKARLNAVPTVKITLGTPFPGAGNDP